MCFKLVFNNKGMTLVEVMMAVAVLGLIILFATQMSTTSSKITGENTDRMDMMEIAREAAEEIRAKYNGGTSFTTPEKDDYYIKYKTNEDQYSEGEEIVMDSGNSLTLSIIVSETPGSSNTYKLVIWLPPKEEGSQ
ncbi:MAG: prepilin-type N-terminal cleavage/methylation domain-containing protein [Clostridiales bacterium]|nr:prepilin-type N-terminal cleavage/methylation domain-containing protein [Clostridiales bacterium]MCF8021146.1 prepilin-type N-terminal cleavage/methylation domain-containing protein [Clostridiales bacterium]